MASNAELFDYLYPVSTSYVLGGSRWEPYNTDCSGVVCAAFWNVFGINPYSLGTWTGAQWSSPELATVWWGTSPYLPWDIMQKGDVIFTSTGSPTFSTTNGSHVGFYSGDPNAPFLSHFANGGPYITAVNGVYGGNEVYFGVRRYMPGAEEDEPVIPEQKPGNAVNDAGLAYRAHVKDAGWLDAVRDGQTAGTVGYGARLEAFKVAPPDGWELRAKVHVQNVGWKTYSGIKKGESSGEGSSSNDPIIGSVGKSQRIEAVIMEVTKRPANDKRKLYFQVHQAGTGWHEWTKEGYASGSDGMGVQLEAIRMKLV